MVYAAVLTFLAFLDVLVIEAQTRRAAEGYLPSKLFSRPLSLSLTLGKNYFHVDYQLSRRPILLMLLNDFTKIKKPYRIIFIHIFSKFSFIFNSYAFRAFVIFEIIFLERLISYFFRTLQNYTRIKGLYFPY